MAVRVASRQCRRLQIWLILGVARLPEVGEYKGPREGVSRSLNWATTFHIAVLRASTSILEQWSLCVLNCTFFPSHLHCSSAFRYTTVSRTRCDRLAVHVQYGSKISKLISSELRSILYGISTCMGLNTTKNVLKLYACGVRLNPMAYIWTSLTQYYI